MNQYAHWIQDNVPACARNTCAEVTEAMQKDFPELKRVRGYFVCADGNRYPHWWLTDLRGNIVDPTAAQFSLGGVYESYDESLGEPNGKCINCGNLSYYDSNFCSEKCVQEFRL